MRLSARSRTGPPRSTLARRSTRRTSTGASTRPRRPGSRCSRCPGTACSAASGCSRRRSRHRVATRVASGRSTCSAQCCPRSRCSLLMFLAVERVAPGFGAATAVLLGAGTLLLPFATLFFDHALSAAVGFAAFVVLLLGSDGRRATLAAGFAGLLAGLAIVAEFPLGLVALVLAGYTASGAAPLRRVATYSAGVVVGAVPLLAYNTWAFGSPLTLSYTNALEAPVGSGEPIVGANEEGFYGVGLPDPESALSLLFSEKGLAVVSPARDRRPRGPAPALAGGTQGRGSRLRRDPPRLPGIQRGVLPSLGRAGARPALPRSRAAFPRAPAGARAARAARRRHHDWARLGRRHGVGDAHRSPDRRGARARGLVGRVAPRRARRNRSHAAGSRLRVARCRPGRPPARARVRARAWTNRPRRRDAGRRTARLRASSVPGSSSRPRPPISGRQATREPSRERSLSHYSRSPSGLRCCSRHVTDGWCSFPRSRCSFLLHRRSTTALDSRSCGWSRRPPSLRRSGRGRRLPAPAQVSGRVEGQQQPLAIAVDLEGARRGEKRLDGLHRTRAEARRARDGR